jgi:hypothetical protein
MDKFIKDSLEAACEKEGLSEQTTMAIQSLLERKLSNSINDAELGSDLESIYELIIGDES